MAVLHNEPKTLRLVLELVDRELPPWAPGGPSPSPEQVRVLGSAAVEWFDRRDQSFWPFMRLPVLYLAGSDPGSLVDSIRDLCSEKSQGFSFRTGAQQELGLQLGRQQGAGFVIEVGMDLAPYLLETSGVQGEPGRELALFRFGIGTADLVKFADQLRQEIAELPPVRT